MTTMPRLQQLASVVSAWSNGPDRLNFVKLDDGVMQRLAAGKPRPVDYEAVKTAHAQARDQVPAFRGHDVVDTVTPALIGYAHDLGRLRAATAEVLGIKEQRFPRLAALWAGVRAAVTGA